MSDTRTAEHLRLDDAGVANSHWRRWGPYVSDRAWGTVREDYSADGTAWDYFPHDHARSRAYRWNEDGIAGVCDRQQEFCLALALWNGRDPILKERFFGLTGTEGNHGEDVKEYYFYLDSTPTHSYMRMLYKYPQRAYPYADLVATNGPTHQARARVRADRHRHLRRPPLLRRARRVRQGRRRTTCCCGSPSSTAARSRPAPRAADRLVPQHLVVVDRRGSARPCDALHPSARHVRPAGRHPDLRHALRLLRGRAAAAVHRERHQHAEASSAIRTGPAVRQGRHQRHVVVQGATAAINGAARHEGRRPLRPRRAGRRRAGGPRALLRRRAVRTGAFADFDDVCAARQAEADAFYATVIPAHLSADAAQVDAPEPSPACCGTSSSTTTTSRRGARATRRSRRLPPGAARRRNADWRHLYNDDVISMPDKWEYPWYAAWDLAFHCVPLATGRRRVRQAPAAADPARVVHAPQRATARVRVELRRRQPAGARLGGLARLRDRTRDRTGTADITFLKRVFHKLLLNFTWWVNRKDEGGNNVFEGGFLGPGQHRRVRSVAAAVHRRHHLEQSDGSSWMAMYSLNLLTIALELARHDPAYEDVATKFWEHFLFISYAMGHEEQGDDVNLWDEEDGFFYDILRLGQTRQQVRVKHPIDGRPHSAVRRGDARLRAAGVAAGLHAPHVLVPRAPARVRRQHRPRPGAWAGRARPVLDRRARAPDGRCSATCSTNDEFLSPFGIRALVAPPRAASVRGDLAGRQPSRGLRARRVVARRCSVATPTGAGPVWFPVNYLLIESLRTLHHYFGDDYRVECPTGSGRCLTLGEVADETRATARAPLSRWTRTAGGRCSAARIASIATRTGSAHVPFHEYFHADTGKGLGASHQTGWTGLIACLLARQRRQSVQDRRRSQARAVRRRRWLGRRPSAGSGR